MSEPPDKSPDGKPGSVIKPQVDAEYLTDVEDYILRAIGALKFGSLEIVVHDGRVVQIEVREKLRFGAKGQVVVKERP